MTQEQIFDWLEEKGYQPREITEEELQEWIDIAVQRQPIGMF